MSLALLACSPPPSAADSGGTEESSTEGGECTPGAQDCPCVAGECLGNELECIDNICTGCILGTLGCECFEGGCLGDYECVGGVCLEPGDGDGDPTGDGDGDPTGDGDGDGDPTGDGDGDGDPTGDGDGDPVETCDNATGTAGCEFYITRFPNKFSGGLPPAAVTFINPSPDTPSTVEIYIKNNGVWVDATLPIEVAPLGHEVYEFNSGAIWASPNVSVGAALRFNSDSPVEVIYSAPGPSAIVGAYVDGRAATHVLPTSAWGYDYRALGWPKGANEGIHASYLVVIASVDNTTLRFRSPAQMAAGAWDAPAPGFQVQIELDAGDTFKVNPVNVGTSVSGTQLTTDAEHPIAVFTGHPFAELYEGDSKHTFILEQNLPIQMWGTEYVGLRAPRLVDAPLSSAWQIAAWQDDTEVTFEYSGTIQGLPPGPVILQNMEFIEFSANGIDNIGDFVISSNQAVGVMNYMVGQKWNQTDSTGAAQIAVAPADRLQTSYVVYVPDYLPTPPRMRLGVGRAVDSPIYFNGQPNDPLGLSQLWMLGDWEAGAWELAEGVTRVTGDEPFTANVVFSPEGYTNYTYGLGYLAGLRTN
ncbi:Transposase [Enhygromyxa salina]|uniref:Transposase n=1 Tax=Enhygromyxa salina TaxID=215803 RepID=A0A0C1Z9B2_9BACT|nr:IgGFc-binding protein [Enhygromyxa salina]KIG14174.1 Transposase [Enhygromyxa salina]